MRKGFLFTGALLAGLLSAGVYAAGGSRTVTFAANFDLDGLPSDADIIHSADAITDSASFTIDAQPDTPRVLAATLTDADTSISACTYTVVGTQADGTVITATTALTGGSGVKTLAPAYNWKTVTSASVGVCTGEGAGDTVSLGTTTAVPVQYVISYGFQMLMPDTSNSKGIFAWRDVPILVTNGAATTDVVAVTASTGPFTNIAVGDLVVFNVDGQVFERVVATRTDADTITVESGVDIATAGVRFSYKKAYYGPDTYDGWFPVSDLAGGSLMVTVLTDQITTGSGFTPTIQCRIVGATGATPVTVVTGTTITAAGAVALTAVDFRLQVWDQCRVGLDMDTVDDAGDSGTEKITVQVGFNYASGR